MVKAGDEPLQYTVTFVLDSKTCMPSASPRPQQQLPVDGGPTAAPMQSDGGIEAPIDVADAELSDAATDAAQNKDDLVADLASLSIKALKERCVRAGLYTGDCLSKSDLVRRAMDGAQPARESPAEPIEWWANLPTKEIKRRLERAEVDVAACFERADFEALARRNPRAGDEREPVAAPAVAKDYWEGYSAKELRKLLADRHVPTAGCLDKADLLAAAALHRAVLLAAAPSGTVEKVPSASIDAKAAEKKERLRAGLEQLGGVVHGGYQVDMFGTKRGRCAQNPRCFRYVTGNHKINGCAMQGMGAVTCSRCGFQNLAHEDLGKWSEGEPHLVDERGDGWRFVDGVDGVRKEKMEPPATSR